MTTFIYYPELTDDNFYKILYKKKEFLDYKNDKDDIRTCDTKKFKAQNTQSIIRNYLSESTIYNGLLLFHGTGSGKTCSSILIAENYLEQNTNKKIDQIYIISSEKLHSQFRKEIFNPNKLPSHQCLSNKYFIYNNGKLNEKEIYKKINENYTFTTYEKFYKTIIKKLFKLVGDEAFQIFKKKIDNENFLEDYDSSYIDLKNIVKKNYSNKIFIIDEIQNIKDDDNNVNLKIMTLKFILKYGENNKLIIMSATPMFDKSEEIIFNINLLLLNDKRELINEHEYMTIVNTTDEMSYKILKDDKISEFKKKIRGYISYVRGDDTNLFPKKINKGTTEYDIKYDALHNKLINEDKKLTDFKLVLVKITNTLQFQQYKKLYNNVNNSNREQELIKTSNIYQNIENEGIEIYDYDKNLKEYSVKFYDILTKLYSKETEGINLLYSREIDASIYPLIKVLYVNGYNFYNESNYTKLIGSLKDDKLNSNRICSNCNNQKKDHINNVCPTEENTFNQAKMVIFHGKQQYKDIINDTIDIINNPINKNGNNIKLIIGSDVISEGVDFKRIQNIHIIEPWHNLSKMDQIVGRGSRFCSHADLDNKNKKVNIYLYALYFDNIDDNFNNNRESIDLLRYRRAINKDKSIKKIERLLKQSAIDCNYNKINNINQILGNDYTRICDYDVCDYKCIYEPDENIIIDTDTYKVNFSYTDVIYVINLIETLFKSGYIELSRGDIIKEIDYINEDIIDYALNKMINTKHLITNKFNIPGYLKYNKYKEPEGVYHFMTNKYDNFEIEDNIYIDTPNKFNIDRVKIKKSIQELTLETYYTNFKIVYDRSIEKYPLKDGHTIGVYIAYYMYNKTPILQSIESDIALFKNYYENFKDIEKEEVKHFKGFYKAYIEKILIKNTSYFVIDNGNIIYKDNIGREYIFKNEINKFTDLDLDEEINYNEFEYNDYYIEYNVKDNKYIMKIIDNNIEKDINFSNNSMTKTAILQNILLTKFNSTTNYTIKCKDNIGFYYNMNEKCLDIKSKLLTKLYLIREGIINNKFYILY